MTRLTLMLRGSVIAAEERRDFRCRRVGAANRLVANSACTSTPRRTFEARTCHQSVPPCIRLEFQQRYSLSRVSFSVASAHAQEKTRSLVAIVTDAASGVLSNAEVVFSHTETGAIRTGTGYDVYLARLRRKAN